MSDDTTAAERWLPIPDWEGYYEVSDLGRVRSIERLVSYRGGTPRRIKSRILRQHTDKFGRKEVTLSVDGRSSLRRVHRLVLAAFVGPPPPGTECCHNDGDPANNSLGNLRYDSHSANMLDKQRHGTDHRRNQVLCKWGHRLAWPNLVRSSARRGIRACLACNLAGGRKRFAKRMGRTFDYQSVADALYEEIMKGVSAA